MKKRILNHNLWENIGGERIRGDFIETRYLKFIKDTMIFKYETKKNDTIIEGFMMKGGADSTYYDKKAKEIAEGNIIEDKFLKLMKDSIVYENRNKDSDTLILKWEYFGIMRIMDPKTKKIGIYSKKGG